MSKDHQNIDSSQEQSGHTPQQDKALKVPGQALVDFLNRVAPGNKCCFCSRGEYDVISAPTGGNVAGVVATPVPNVQHLGIWFFVASCDNCGHTALFNSKEVLESMTKED